MKITTTILLLATFTACGQLQQINTSNRQTNVVTSTRLMTAPGFFTNLPVTLTETNIVIGDTLATSFGKVNNGWLWLGIVVRATNASNGYIPYYTNSSPFYFWSAPPTGGGGTSNAIPIYSGGGTNLTVTNRFNLVSTVPNIGIGTLTISNYGVFTAVGNGYYTNTNGVAITIIGTGAGPGVGGNPTSPPWGTNTITTNNTYPWNGYASQVNLIQVTNGVGTGWYYPLDPLHYIFVSQTNKPGSTNVYTSSVIFSGSSRAGANQGYISNSTTLWTGVTDSSYTMNYNGNPLFRWIIYQGADHNIQSKAASAGTPPTGFWDGGTAGGGRADLGLSTNYTTNATVYWTYYSTNAWRFFSSTNPVTFVSPAQTIYATNPTAIFYVTNCAINPVTNSSPTNSSTAYPNNYGTNVIFYGWYQGTNGYYWSGYIPGTSNIMVITWTNPPIITLPPPPIVSSPPCASYISATVGGVCKTLTDGMRMIDECASLNNATGIALSHLDLAADGTATWVLFDRVVDVIPWNDSRWTLDAPADACVSCQQNSPPLPCSFGGGSTSGSGGVGIPPQTVTVGHN